MQIEILDRATGRVILSGVYALEGTTLVSQNGAGRSISLADLPSDIVVNIFGTRNKLSYVKATDTLKIGCIMMTSAQWVDRVDIGYASGYSDDQVNEYNQYTHIIKAIAGEQS